MWGCIEGGRPCETARHALPDSPAHQLAIPAAPARLPATPPAPASRVRAGGASRAPNTPPRPGPRLLAMAPLAASACRPAHNLLGARPAPFVQHVGLRRLSVGYGVARATLRCGPLRAGRGSKLQVRGGAAGGGGAAPARRRNPACPRSLAGKPSAPSRFGGAHPVPGGGVAARHASDHAQSGRPPPPPAGGSAGRKGPRSSASRPPAPPAGGQQAFGHPRGPGPVQPRQRQGLVRRRLCGG